MTDDTRPQPPGPGEADDPGAGRSLWVALAALAGVVAWMASGLLLPGGAPAPGPGVALAPEPPAVRVHLSRAAPVTLTFRAEGQALPERDSTVRAEASGTVAALPATKGARVAQGAVIARLSATQAEAALAQAQQERARAQREFDNAVSLLDRGIATADRVAQARATLAAAEAQVASAEETLENLTLVAPFTGRIERLPVEVGEFVTAGEELARIVDTDPLTVAIQVPQTELGRIETGQAARIRFITGQERAGTVTFVGSAAAPGTRTFLAEIEVANADGAIPAGVSAEVTIPTGQAEAHFVAPSTVSLGPDGALGVKIVEGDVVRFVPVEIVRAEIDGLWTTGLPAEARIITLGQGFVRDGERVRAQPTEGPDAPAPAPTAAEVRP